MVKEFLIILTISVFLFIGMVVLWVYLGEQKKD